VRNLTIEVRRRSFADRVTHEAMRSLSLPLLLCAAGLITACRKDTAPPKPKADAIRVDACTLLSKQEIEAVQKSPITDTKTSEQAAGDFRMAQCFYTAAEFNRSINLAVIQKDASHTQTRTPKQFWDETFVRAAEKKDKDDKEAGEEKERRTPPKKIDGVGDDAYWVPNRFGGVLYVLKDDTFISISVGGPDPEQTKIDKSKALAQKAIRRL
jgi:hypothetical protein